MTIDTQALLLTLKLAFFTLLFLIPFGIWVAYRLANMQKGKSFLEAILALPLVLPPTVLGYYLLVTFSNITIFNQPLTFTFTGLIIASIIFNLPFAIQPIQRAFEAIPQEIREAAQCSGLNPWKAFKLIELPLAWRGIVSAAVITFAHTLGEFGVILMIGGSIPGETQTIAISIYDSVQNMDHASASGMSLLLLIISLVAITWSYQLTGKKRVA